MSVISGSPLPQIAIHDHHQTIFTTSTSFLAYDNPLPPPSACRRAILKRLREAYGKPHCKHPRAKTKRSDRDMTVLRLPPEILLEIGDFLPPDTILSLKLTHSTFNNTLPRLA